MSVLQVRDTDHAVIAAPRVIKFDLPETDRLRAELEVLTPEAETKPLLIDLAAVEFVPSATLGVLVELANRCRRGKRPLALIRLKPRIREVFRVCSLDTVFAIHDDEAAALEAL